MEKIEYRRMYHLETWYWWFIGKQFLVRQVLEHYARLQPDTERLLDLGCGTGIILKLLQRAGRPYGLELNTEAIRFLRKRNLKGIVQADLTRPLPFKDGSFAVVFCLDVLEHIENDGNLICEMLRLCRKGGKIIITVPAFNWLWSDHDIALHHKRRYVRDDLLGKLKRSSCGFKILKETYFNAFFFFPIVITRRLRRTIAKTVPFRTDFDLRIPGLLNRLFSWLYKSEIWCLSHISGLRWPIGVSLLMIIEKTCSHTFPQSDEMC